MQGLSEADRAAIAAVTQAIVDAFNAGDWAAVAAVYMEDAVVMPPNAPLMRGRSAIEAYCSKLPPISNFTITKAEIDGVGDLAYVFGANSLTFTPEGAEPFRHIGKFVYVLKKQADGSWAICVECDNSDLPVPAPPLAG